METSLGTTTYSRTRVRATSVSKAIAIGIVFLALVSPSTTISYGFLAVVALFVVTDGVASFRSLRRQDFKIETTRSVAMSPEQLMFSIDAGASSASRSITPVKFSEFDRSTERRIGIESGSDEAVVVSVDTGSESTVRGFVQFEVSATFFGLIEAHRTLVFDPATLLYRTQAFAPHDPNLQPLMVSGVGKLRPYQPGDRRSRVAWATTARTGELYIRDHDDEGEETVVVLDLGAKSVNSSEEVRNQVAETKSLAGSAISNLLDQGVPVTLRSLEPGDEFHAVDLAMALDFSSNRTADPADFSTHLVERVVLNHSELVERIAAATTGQVGLPAGRYLLARDRELREAS